MRVEQHLIRVEFEVFEFVREFCGFHLAHTCPDAEELLGASLWPSAGFP